MLRGTFISPKCALLNPQQSRHNSRVGAAADNQGVEAKKMQLIFFVGTEVRNYVFQATSVGERDRWVEGLRKLMKPQEEEEEDGGVLEGFLMKKSPRKVTVFLIQGSGLAAAVFCCEEF